MILRGGLTLSRFIINNHSRIVNHSADVCRNFIKSRKKIYAAPWFRHSVQKESFLRFQVAFRQQKRLHSAGIHCVYRGIPFHLQIPPVRTAGVGQLHGGAVLAGDYGGEYRCIKTAGGKVCVRSLSGGIGAQGRQQALHLILCKAGGGVRGQPPHRLVGSGRSAVSAFGRLTDGVQGDGGAICQRIGYLRNGRSRKSGGAEAAEEPGLIQLEAGGFVAADGIDGIVPGFLHIEIPGDRGSLPRRSG